MKLATSTNILFRRPDGSLLDMYESLELCAEAGYRYLDMNFVDASNFNENFHSKDWQEWIWKIKKRADELDISFVQAHGAIYNFCDQNLSKKEHKIKERNVDKSIEMAALLGVPWIVFHPETDYNSPDFREVSREKNIEFYSKKLKLAADFGIGIALENMWDLNISPLKRYCVNSAELIDLVSILKEDYDNVSICCDVEHLGLMGLDFYKEIQAYGDYLSTVHISDYNSIEEDHIIPFHGKINWNEVLLALKSVKYQGYFTYEIHNYCKNVPDDLILPALKYSLEVGNYLIEQYEKL